MSEIIKKLAEIQRKLNAPKGQRNNFGNYNYRSCEDILQAVKPHLGESVILVSDDIKVFLDRVYVQATAKLCLDGQIIETTAYARESLTKKGMDEAQITGSASSYARKYALNGLLLIDDNKDPDTRDNSKEGEIPHPNSKEAQAAKQKAREDHPKFSAIAGYLANQDEWPFAKEAMEEMTRAEQIEIFQLCNTAEKQIIRELKIKGGAE